ncbi:hypothetical protein OS493_011164 [Desmophyllum pertusum]|uniref:Uncharacterized protein n=1 Tax=Desmophyllum pertusum TaxID=174260 RepID=A0A9W9Z1P9_9CNID|nr:hypothetical protein OS493_011164 [Desmophyllum pertusum]
MEESQVLRNTNSQTAEDRQLKTDQKSLHGEPPNASTFHRDHRTNPAFMSPTDNFFSPCTRKLTSKRGLHLMALSQRQLGKAFQKESSIQDSKENKPN